jgi:hypothetical protein
MRRLSAAILFALITIMAREPLYPVVLTAWQVTLGFAPMMVLGLLFGRPHVGALSEAGAFGIGCSAIGPIVLCYLTWFAALRRAPRRPPLLRCFWSRLSGHSRPLKSSGGTWRQTVSSIWPNSLRRRTCDKAASEEFR